MRSSSSQLWVCWQKKVIIEKLEAPSIVRNCPLYRELKLFVFFLTKHFMRLVERRNKWSNNTLQSLLHPGFYTERYLEPAQKKRLISHKSWIPSNGLVALEVIFTGLFKSLLFIGELSRAIYHWKWEWFFSRPCFCEQNKAVKNLTYIFLYARSLKL